MKNLLLLLIVAILAMACGKAGTGGKATVIVHGIYEDMGTPGAVVYVKFNETNYNPSWTGGDLQDTINNFSEVEFGSLKRGDYYFWSRYTYINDSGYVDTVSCGKYIRIETKPSAYHLTLDFSSSTQFE